MKFTGERYLPSESGRIRLEHFHRYISAGSLVLNKNILDVACGEGYGSSYLSRFAMNVVGIDLSTEAIEHARENYLGKNLSFEEGSATALPFSDDLFDCVVSFETIEHLAEQSEMLAEIRRVMKPEGMLIISSPNRPIYSEESGEHNEFHVKELDFEEFDSLLTDEFPSVKYYGQRMLMGSLIQPLAEESTHYNAWTDDESGFRNSTGKIQDPVYFLAVCSEFEFGGTEIETTFLRPDSLDLVRHYTNFAKWAIAQEDLVSDLRMALASSNPEIEERLTDHYSHSNELEAEIGRLTCNIEDQMSAIMELQEAIKAKEDQLIVRSQELENQISGHCSTITDLQKENFLLMEEIKVVAERKESVNPASFPRKIIQIVESAYHKSPLKESTKLYHRRLLAKYFPKLLESIVTKPSTSVINAPGHVKSENIEPDGSDLIRRAMSIEFSLDHSPDVSIIIPVYGKIAYTLMCLESIAACNPEGSYEVIVVDDFSPDESRDVLGKVNCIRLLCNGENSGFIRSCNSGAAAANGEYLVFLNNDTEVTKGWLDELLFTFESFPGTGLVGSKLVYPSGALQEAGAIIWQDGRGWNFGRNMDPALPEFNYAREVDYCSGASIMLPKELFNRIGGFDELYLPAYCEDADIALRLRSEGYRVIYQPKSVVIHHEGITSGTDTGSGVKSYQVENTLKLHERWKNLLLSHEPPGESLDTAKDRRASRRVLLIDHCTPTPDRDSGSIDAFNLMLLFRELDFQVTFIPEDNFTYMEPYTSNLQRAGIEVLYGPYVTTVKQHLQEYGDRYDLVMLFRPAVAGNYLSLVREMAPSAKVIFHTVDLHYLRLTREAELNTCAETKKIAEEMKRKEVDVIRRADVTTVVSVYEQQALKEEFPDLNVETLPYSRKVHGSSHGFDDRSHILFVGGFQHPPNTDAVLYFIDKVMPILRNKIPGVQFHIVGSQVPPEIENLASQDIIVYGYVKDLQPILDQARVSVAPLRFGAGIKGKIGTALTSGLPTVSTTLAAEGMDLEDGKDVLIADSPEEIATAVAELYCNPDIWKSLSSCGLETAERLWGCKSAIQTLSNLLSGIGIKVDEAKYTLSQYDESMSIDIAEKPISILRPVASLSSLTEYEAYKQSAIYTDYCDLEHTMLQQHAENEFFYKAYCGACGGQKPMLVDMLSGGIQSSDGWVPNWRERLECDSCKMNNRQRLVATLVEQHLSGQEPQKVYFMEQVTPIFHWAAESLGSHELLGSEYLGHEYAGGSLIQGIRHEDIENLSMPANDLDLIVSNDVFEHVPNPSKAFAECARVLKPGGVMLATIPFHAEEERSVVRAVLNNGDVENKLPPAFHGNPISAEGSLVFTDFGWDMLNEMTDSGFKEVFVDIYASANFGHLGRGQLVFRAVA